MVDTPTIKILGFVTLSQLGDQNTEATVVCLMPNRMPSFYAATMANKYQETGDIYTAIKSPLTNVHMATK